MSATSLEGARHLMKIANNSAHHINNSNKGILVGGSERNEVHLSPQEVNMIKSFLASSSSGNRVPELAFGYKSLLKPQQGIEGQGLLYRSREHALLDVESQGPSVVLIERFLCLEIGGEYHKFVQGQFLPSKLDESGNIVIFSETGFPILCKDSLPKMVIQPVTCILRKVMVVSNPFEPQESVVIDFMRKSMPLLEHDIVVPFYPERGDMVLINGTDPEPWLGEVMTVDVTNQLAKVRYYIRNGEREVFSILVDVFVSERNAWLDQVSWNAIVCAAIGEWNGNTWEMMPFM